MNKSVLVAIVNEVSAVGYADPCEALHEALMKAVRHIDFGGHMLSEYSRNIVSVRFDNICGPVAAGEVSLLYALEFLCQTYEDLIFREKIEASVSAGVLSRETADEMYRAFDNKNAAGNNQAPKQEAPKKEAPKKEAPKKEQKTEPGFFDGVKSGLKDVFANVKKEVESKTPIRKEQVESYGKLDTAHNAIAKGINTVYATNKVVITGATVVGCGAVDVAAVLAKGGILATSVVAKEANKLGYKAGHKANDSVYEAGKSVVKKVNPKRNMDVDAIYDL